MSQVHYTGPNVSTGGFSVDGTTNLVTADIAAVAGITPGTVAASKAIVVDSNKDASSCRNFSATNLKAGASGSLGSVTVYPTTASKGNVTLTAADAAGNTVTDIHVAAQSGARTYTVPDAGASASYVMSTGTSTGIAATSAELNTMSGILATAAELNLNNTLNAANIETLAANGANTVTLTKKIHKVDTTAGAQTCTPAAPGAANLGVVHVIEMTVRGGSNNLVITQTNIDGGSAGSTITFSAVGHYVALIGGVSKWHVVSGTATFA